MGPPVGSSRLNALSISLEAFDVVDVCAVQMNSCLQWLIRSAIVLNISFADKNGLLLTLCGA
jgi:hypothetical protein